MSDRRYSSGRGRDDRSGGGRDDKRGGGGDDRRSAHTTSHSERNRREHSPSSQRWNVGGGGGGSSGPGGGGPSIRAGTASRMRDLNGQAFSESELMTDLPKKKFTGRCRLFVGNLPNEVKEQELKELFSPHGDIAECYLSGKGFAFLRLDTRAHAESAKEAIDSRIIHGRQVRVRFAVHGAALRVKELSPTVSNEMLYHAFAHFGDVERAVHIVDEKGRPTGEGIVEFERKPSANEAIAAIKDGVFLLTACPKPLVVEQLEPRDEDDGLAERMIPRSAQLQKEREIGPRFPAPNTFECVYGMKWKELYENEKRRRDALEEELKESRKRLEADMELAYQDYQAQMLREDLQRRQLELERLEAQRRSRMGLGGGGGMNGIGGGSNGGPPSIYGGPPPPDFGANMYGGGGGAFGGPPQGGPGGHGGHGGPPPFPHMQQPPQQHPPGRGPPTGGPNVMEGVQRLLQIFKSDPDRGGPNGPPQPHPQQPPQAFGAFGVPPQPMGGPGVMGGPFGGPPNPGFGRPNNAPNEYPPPEKRRR